MDALRRAIEDKQRVQRDSAAPGRLALSKSEAAEALGISVDFLEEHVTHELRVVRCGRRRLIPVAELERWLDEHALRARGEPKPGAIITIATPEDDHGCRGASTSASRYGTHLPICPPAHLAHEAGARCACSSEAPR